MKSLDRMIKSDRRNEYKLLRRLRKSRDAARKYVKHPIKVSELQRFYARDFVQYNYAHVIAKDIVDRKGVVKRIRPPKPPSQNMKKEPNPPSGPEPIIGRRK